MSSIGEETVDGEPGGRYGDENEEGPCAYHPLLNDVILGTLVNHLRQNDLKKCRAVCQKWNLLTIPLIRSKFRVTIQGNQPENGRKIENFVETFRSNKLGIPFCKFRLGSFSTTHGAGQEFLKLCGDSITEISFMDQVFQVEDVSEILRSTPVLESFRIPPRLRSQSGNVVKLFPESEKSKPELRFLKTFHIKNEYKGRSECCPTFLEEIITAAPNICDLDISDHYSDEPNLMVPNSLEVLRIIEKFGREASLSTLHLRAVTTEHVEILSRMKLKGLSLKNLKSDNYTSFSHAFELAPIFKESLVYLHVMERSPIGIGYKLPQLKSLGISTFNETLLRCAGNLNNNFPALEDLRIFSTDLNPHRVYADLTPGFEPCPTIKSLSFYYVRMNSTVFNRLLTIFPMLSKLRLFIRVDEVNSLNQIWTQLGQLEALSIFIQFLNSGNENLDSLLTGIPNDRLQEISQLVNGLEQMTVKVRNETILSLKNEHCQHPSIGNLTNLRYLEIMASRYGDGGDQSYLTDLSAYFGLYTMKHLKHLVVKKCAFTKTCCEILRTEMELDLWAFAGGSDLDIIPPNRNSYFRDK